MPRKKKPASELTTEEAMSRLFPKRVVMKMREETEKSSKAATKDKSK